MGARRERGIRVVLGPDDIVLDCMSKLDDRGVVAISSKASEHEGTCSRCLR